VRKRCALLAWAGTPSTVRGLVDASRRPSALDAARSASRRARKKPVITSSRGTSRSPMGTTVSGVTPGSASVRLKERTKGVPCRAASSAANPKSSVPASSAATVGKWSCASPFSSWNATTG
jgi:hypothetical protein